MFELCGETEIIKVVKPKVSNLVFGEIKVYQGIEFSHGVKSDKKHL